MKIRLLQLANNFYCDRVDKQVNSNPLEPLGTWCSFGYFDALQVSESYEVGAKRQDISDILQKVAIEQLNGKCSLRNVVCCINQDKADEEFWEFAQTQPFLFVSMIRIERESDDELKQYIKTVNCLKEYSSGRDEIAYYSNEHSHVVLVKCCKKYSEGFNFIVLLQKKFKVRTMFSVFSVREEILKNEGEICDLIDDERVNCRLTAVVKNMNETNNFIEVLHNIIKSKGCKIVTYLTLGRADCIIDIYNVQLSQMLFCYATGQILTHMNVENYDKSFYNIETEFWPKEEWKVWRHG